MTSKQGMMGNVVLSLSCLIINWLNEHFLASLMILFFNNTQNAHINCKVNLHTEYLYD